MWAANEGMGWWMVFGGVFWMLLIVALIYAFSGAFDGGPRDGAASRETPLEIAKRRLAAGEISHDEYERLRETLHR